jgi:hypothetical protein
MKTVSNLKLAAQRESTVEQHLSIRVVGAGGRCLKLKGPRGWPDRLCMLRGRVLFVETKRPVGGRLSKHQGQWVKDLLAQGMDVAVCSTIAEVDEAVDALIG